MSDITQKIVVAIASALVGGFMTYAGKALSIEGRLDGIERAVIRIEQKISK